MRKNQASPRPTGLLRIAIVTVSTSKYRKLRAKEEVGDQSGDSAVSIVRRAGYKVSERFLISDDPHMLRSRMDRFLAGRDDVAIFVGGTGISPDDVTIETVRPYLEREIEGFGELFRGESYMRIGPSAFLSRATAGIVQGKLIVCLPGSPDGVRTALGMFVSQFPLVILSARS